MNIKLNPAAVNAYIKLRSRGATVYVVGGAVRDFILGLEPKDIDLVAVGIPDAEVAAIPGFFKTGDSFGVYRYKCEGTECEIALPRTEVSTGPGHQDYKVTVDHNLPIEADLARRDFTMNAMAQEISPNSEIIDLFGGQEDLKLGIVRHFYPNVFIDDPLRIMRAFVPVSRYGFDLSVETQMLMIDSANRLPYLAAERIQQELDKIFEGDFPDLAIIDMRKTGALPYVFPELAEIWDYDQNNPHHEQILGNHSVDTLTYVRTISDDPDLRLAALLHDIGKPKSAWVDPETGSNHFYEKKLDNGTVVGAMHENVGADMAWARLTELKYPVVRRDRIAHLIAGHMWAPFTTLKGARRFLNKHGELADDLLTLRYGDQGGKTVYPATPEHDLAQQRELILLVREQGDATQTSDLAINGHDLIEAGFEPGPVMGEILNYLTDLVLDTPGINEKDILLSIAEDTYSDLLV